MPKRTAIVPRHNKLKKTRVALQPGLSQRIIRVLEETGRPKEEQVPNLCERTGLRKQSVYRWIAAEDPGSPDLQSFAILCEEFNIDANWLLGLVQAKLPLRPPPGRGTTGAAELGKRAFVDAISKDIDVLSAGCEPMRMQGDEMEPRIKSGALMLVDVSIKKLDGNGIYVLEDRGKRMVRRIEHRVGQGIAVMCDNSKYRETILADQSRKTPTVFGRVRFWIDLAAA